MATERTAGRETQAARRALRERRGGDGRRTFGDRTRRERDLEVATPPPEAPMAPPGRIDPEPRRYDWRNDVIGFSGLNIIAGIWLIIAPWVLGYSGRDPRWNDVVFGAIVAVLALVRVAGGYRETWLSWINALIGVWVFIAAFTIDHTGRAIWNDIILGAVVFALALGSAGSTPRSGTPPAV